MPRLVCNVFCTQKFSVFIWCTVQVSIKFNLDKTNDHSAKETKVWLIFALMQSTVGWEVGIYTIPTLKTSVRTNFRPGFENEFLPEFWVWKTYFYREKLCAKPLLKFCVEIHFSRYQNLMWKNSTIFQSSMENVYGKNEWTTESSNFSTFLAKVSI